MKSKLSVRELCFIGIFVAVMAVCAQVNIQLPGGVPFTLQAWAVGLAGLVLGAKNGTIAALVYVLLGIAGVPVFVGFFGGLGILAHPTGGFVLSFPLLALLAGLGEKSGRVAFSFIGLVAGVVVNFACGLLYFSWITGLGLPESFGFAVVPFVVPTVVKIVVIPVIGKSIKGALHAARVTV